MEKVKVLQKTQNGYELTLDSEAIAPIPVTKTYADNVLRHFQAQT